MDWNYCTSLVGLVTITYLSFQCLCFLWKMLRWYGLTSIGFVKDLKKYGEWVIVTGATDGIGKEYVKQLAKQGFKIVLVSRTKEKLQQVSKEIEEEFHVETKFICFDFTQTAGYDKIEEVIRDLDVGILVNNVGMLKVFKDGYASSDINEHYNVLNCNVSSDIHMTYLVLKGMIERKRGAIVHISSIIKYYDFPCNIYGGTKSFIGKFCKSLQLEGSGIDHQLVTPSAVSSNMSKKEPGPGIPSAENYVKSAIRTIGVAEVTCGYFIHELQKLLVDAITSIFLMMPTSLCSYLQMKMIKKSKLD